MADPTSTSVPPPDSGSGDGDTNYLVVALVVGIPCSIIILVLALLISVMFYLTCRTPRREEEAVYIRKRFQGISLEQQRKRKAKKKKRNKRVVGRRRESGVSGIFSGKVSRTPSSVSAAARRNPFGMQEWQIRMYSRSGGAQGGGEGSPDTEETDVSGDEMFQRRDLNHLVGAINPLMIQGQDHNPGYDTPPQTSRKPHPQAHSHSSQPSQKPHPPASANESQSASGRGLQPRAKEEEIDKQESSSDESMNPYDNY